MSLLQLVHKNSLRRRETENANMKIGLFGATGKTGIYYLKFALDKGLRIKAFVRSSKKLKKMTEKYKFDQDQLEVVECDIFKPEVLDFTEVDLIVSCLGFHRRNNKQFKIDHYTRSMDSILTAAEKQDVRRLITMSSWYSETRGEEIEGGGISGCCARFFIKNMIGHVLLDMDNMHQLLSQNTIKELQWQVICFPGLRKRSTDKKDIIWEKDRDYVNEIVQNYPMHKTKYYTVSFCDAAEYLIKISEEKLGLPKNCLISVANKP